jgi:hypothetical protein
MQKSGKFKFKRQKYQVLNIVDENKKEIGSVRIEPNEISWKPAGTTRWYTLPIQQFAELAVAKGVKSEIAV